MNARIGICLGDVTGIGPEVALKALAQEIRSAQARYLVIGDERIAHRLNAELKLGLTLSPYSDAKSPEPVCILDSLAQPLPLDLGPGASVAAEAALAYLTAGAKRCLAGELGALVTAPVNKESIMRLGKPFVGQTEFLSELARTDRTVMMLLGEDDRGRWLRVALATTHLPLRAVADRLSQAAIELAIQRASEACRDLRLNRARIGVCGLNPHAGEGGKMGTEEITIIAPAVERARSRGIDVVGPLAADTLFHYAYRGDFEAVVAMYHDQGLVPLKMVGFEKGVNWTLGLPFIRTSPDHGTAYDIAGQGRANPSSFVSAIHLANALLAKASPSLENEGAVGPTGHAKR